MLRVYLTSITLLLIGISTFAQIGGNNTFEFLNLPASARAAALGGNAITFNDADLSIAYQNPALISPKMHNEISVSSVAYFSGVNFGHIAIAKHYDSIETTFSGGLQYAYYGVFDGYDATGQPIADFGAAETALNLGAARSIKKFTYGANAKIVYSQLEQYSAFGLALDLGGTYTDTTKRINVSAVVKNIGLQVKAFRPNNREPVPFEIQLGVSQKLKHLPFRWSIIGHNLQTPNIRFDDPTQVQENTLFADTVANAKEQKFITDKIFRHIIFGGEFYFGKNFRARIGYNHLRRQELSIEPRRAIVGFSLGAGVRIKQFNINYAWAKYSLAGASNHFTLTTNLDRFGKN